MARGIRLASRFAALGLLLLSACHAPSGVGAGADWPGYGGGTDESSYSRLARIDTSNVARLGLAWSLDLPGEVTLEATPVAVGGALYFTGGYGAVYAADGASGKLLWKYDPQVWKHNPAKLADNFAVNRGVAYAGGRIFAAAFDGRLFALDAKTGKLLWSVETVPADTMHYVTGAPRVFKDKVIIGHGGADFGYRGYVTAYDQATGKQAWRFYTVPGAPEQNRGDPAMEKAAATWRGEYWKTGTGGAVWDNIAFDPELNRVYLGTANAGPSDPEKRSPGGGDNLYTASIVALDADSGKYVWHYQVNPRDSWDYDATQRMILAELTIDGQRRKVLMQAPKNGFLYVLDRTNGKLISAGKIGKATWADHIDVATGRPVEAPNIRYETGDVVIWPSPAGAHSWQAMSFSPKTGLVYIPYMQTGAHFYKGLPEPGAIYIAGLSIGWAKGDPADGKGALVAYDPVRQTRAWAIPHESLLNGGTLATAGGLVFQGDGLGVISAYDAANGKALWRYDAGLGVQAAPMSFEANGKQYVSVLVGWGGSASIGSNRMNVGWKYGAQPRRLLTFALDGKATLPTSAPRDLTVRAVDDPKLVLKPEDVAAGRSLFLACALCHGRDAVSGGTAPDLRESRIALDPDSFWNVVHEGALIQNGMPRFEALSREQVMQIQAYIRSRAREALAAPPPGG
jgi:quinohemoprotein ethanol dehydrogenase